MASIRLPSFLKDDSADAQTQQIVDNTAATASTVEAVQKMIEKAVGFLRAQQDNSEKMVVAIDRLGLIMRAGMDRSTREKIRRVEVMSRARVAAEAAKDQAQALRDQAARDEAEAEGKPDRIPATVKQEKDNSSTTFLERISGALEPIRALSIILKTLFIPVFLGFITGLAEGSGALRALGNGIDYVSDMIDEYGGRFSGAIKVMIGAMALFPRRIMSILTTMYQGSVGLLRGLRAAPGVARGALAATPAMLGRVVGGASRALRFAGPVGTAIAGAIGGVQGAIDGYDEDGIRGAVRGALSGVVSSLIGWIGDLATWAVGSLLELLGVDELGKQIREFDFTGTVRSAMNGLFDLATLPTRMFGMMWDQAKDTFASAMAAFNRLMDGESLAAVGSDFLKDLASGIIDRMTRMVMDLIPVDWIPDGALRMLTSNFDRLRSQVGLPPIQAASSAPVAPMSPATSNLPIRVFDGNTEQVISPTGQIISSRNMAVAATRETRQMSVPSAPAVNAAAQINSVNSSNVHQYNLNTAAPSRDFSSLAY